MRYPGDARAPWIARACIAAITSYDWVVASRSALVRAAPFVALVGVVGVFLFLSFVKVQERDLSLRINEAPSFRGISSTGTRLPRQSRVREVLARLLS